MNLEAAPRGGSHAQRRDSWFCHHQEFWYCRVFYSIYFDFYIWTEWMNRIYAWMNRLLLEATLCSVPVFCIWPWRRRPLSMFGKHLCIKKIFWLASAMIIVRYIKVFEQLQLVLMWCYKPVSMFCFLAVNDIVFHNCKIATVMLIKLIVAFVSFFYYYFEF